MSKKKVFVFWKDGAVGYFNENPDDSGNISFQFNNMYQKLHVVTPESLGDLQLLAVILAKDLIIDIEVKMDSVKSHTYILRFNKKEIFLYDAFGHSVFRLEFSGIKVTDTDNITQWHEKIPRQSEEETTE